MTHSLFYTKPTLKGISLFSSKVFVAGEIICPFSAFSIVDTPNQKTIQIGEKQHIHLQPEILQYTNHNCDPNVYFNTSEMHLECIRDIGIDDEITFFYPSTEWHMAEPFECQCGAINCLRIIKGAKDMDKKVLSRYKLSKYINESISI